MNSLCFEAWREESSGGGKRNRTDDLLLAKQPLYQLSYTPELFPQAISPKNRVKWLTYQSGLMEIFLGYSTFVSATIPP